MAFGLHDEVREPDILAVGPARAIAHESESVADARTEVQVVEHQVLAVLCRSKEVDQSIVVTGKVWVLDVPLARAEVRDLDVLTPIDHEEVPLRVETTDAFLDQRRGEHAHPAQRHSRDARREADRRDASVRLVSL